MKHRNYSQQQPHDDVPLQDVMNSMARHVEGLSGGRAMPRSEIEAYAVFDPVLAQLLKQYREAQERHDAVLRRNGPDDAMVAVAADMIESGESAVETRLIELRADTVMCRMVQTRLFESRQGTHHTGPQENKRRNQRLYHQRRQTQEEMFRKKQEDARIGVLWLWFVLVTLQQALNRAQDKLSAACAFAAACERDQHKRVLVA